MSQLVICLFPGIKVREKQAASRQPTRQLVAPFSTSVITDLGGFSSRSLPSFQPLDLLPLPAVRPTDTIIIPRGKPAPDHRTQSNCRSKSTFDRWVSFPAIWFPSSGTPTPHVSYRLTRHSCTAPFTSAGVFCSSWLKRIDNLAGRAISSGLRRGVSYLR